MENNESHNDHVTIKFLKTDLKVRKKDFVNPLVPMLISQVELVEIKFAEGYVYYKNLKENYKILFEDKELDKQILDILIAKHKNAAISPTDTRK